MNEFIICAAIWFKDGKQYEDPHQPTNIDSGYVLSGWRHGCIYAQNMVVFGRTRKDYIEPSVQGFLTSRNRFVDRIEAAKIHTDNGNTLNYGKELYSEDLY